MQTVKYCISTYMHIVSTLIFSLRYEWSEMPWDIRFQRNYYISLSIATYTNSSMISLLWNNSFMSYCKAGTYQKWYNRLDGGIVWVAAGQCPGGGAEDGASSSRGE